MKISENVEFLSKRDVEQLSACYNRLMDKTNGLIELSDFDNGRAHLPNNGNFDVEIKLDVAEFSSMVLGAINFSQLYRYGLAQISDEGYLDVVNQLFLVARRPLCLTTF